MIKTINNTCVIMPVFVIVIIGLLLSSSYSSAASTSSTTANASVTVGSACTFTGTVSTAHNAEVPNGTNRTDIGSTVLNTICNDNGGFAIYAVGYSSSEYGNNTMINQADSTITFNTGTSTSGNNSNWSMKLTQVTTGTYATTIDNSFNAYHNVPATYTKVAHRDSVTDASSTNPAVGSSISLTYQTYISGTQPAGTYQGKVKFTMVHPANEIPAQPVACAAGYICYNASGGATEGTMGRQPASDGNTAALFPSNFSRTGYGFAGWSDAYDYETNPNAHFYGPNEDIVVPTGTTDNGLSLYAVWIKSAGIMQHDAQSICSNLTATTYNDEGDADEATWSITANLNSISALTDNRDGQTYAIAKLSDNKCWMIENLRLADKDSNNNDIILSNTNTNNPSLPLTNVYDTGSTSNHLSPTSSIAYNATTAPEGWCTDTTYACYNQSRIRTNNTTNRVIYTITQAMSTNANLYSYGNYYNWYSATAGNGIGSKSSGNTEGDICPYGWRLPTGTGSGEFGLLSNSLGGYKNGNNVAQTMNDNDSTVPSGTIMDKRLRHFPNDFVHPGDVSGASIPRRGVYGRYWSSTANSNRHAYYLTFHASYASPGTDYLWKYSGAVVRCIANGV